MRSSCLLPLFLLPLYASAQSSGGGGSQTDNVILSTSQLVTETLGPGRVQSTITSNVVYTLTQSPQATASGNSTSNSTASGASGNATSSTRTTTPSNLPTAPSAQGGGAAGGAPYPGATSGCGGACGPDDDYINAAQQLVVNSLTLGALGAFVGGGMLLL